MTSQTATYMLTSDGYIAHGGFGTEQSQQEWADTFHSLGGESAFVNASWRFDTDGPVLIATGTAASLEYIEQTVAA